MHGRIIAALYRFLGASALVAVAFGLAVWYVVGL